MVQDTAIVTTETESKYVIYQMVSFPMTLSEPFHLSLSSGNFHHTLKESVISPLLKKPTLDKDELSNYRPISNLSLISKIIERVVKSRN